MAKKPKSPSRQKPSKSEEAEELSREEELFFQEVDEELKQERAAQIWKKYGVYVIGAAVAVVVAVAGWRYWSSEQQAERAAANNAYHIASAQARQGEIADATQRYLDLIKKYDGGFASLARLRAAGLLARSNDVDGALEMYRELADDTSAAPSLRHYATMMWALHGIDKLDAATVRPRLQPLAEEDSHWRFSAREMLGLYANKAGERAEAIRTFRALAADEQAPLSLRLRAREMIEILGGTGDQG